MKDAAKRFESGNLPDHIRSLIANPLPAQLIAIAQNFIRLQEERHKADYDLATRFERARAQDAVALAVQSFADWEMIRNTDEARVFLASLMFWKLWSK